MGRTPEWEVLVVAEVRAEVGASVPCRADAERAAAALADAGVGRVVLFGSVARGKATICSDIDLVAIYDDLDYRRRDQSQDELSALARAAAGHPVDVIVTDRPEWKIRTEQVTTSVESRAARSGVVLVDRRAAADVNWGKEMVVPTSDHAEAVERLVETNEALVTLLGHLEPSSLERLELRAGNEDRAFNLSEVRLRRACGEAHRTVEASLKSLIHLDSAPGGSAWGHDIARLCEQLVEPHRSAVPRLLDPLGAAAMTTWYEQSRYRTGARYVQPTQEVVRDMARIACSVATYTAGRFDPDVPAADDIRWSVGHIEDRLGRSLL